jgi:hypothetical protein
MAWNYRPTAGRVRGTYRRRWKCDLEACAKLTSLIRGYTKITLYFGILVWLPHSRYHARDM